MRGKPDAAALTRRRGRITPAYAGKTLSLSRRCALPGDHPRVCGENEYASMWQKAAAGSPPRMRGKLAVSGFFAAPDGITPAYAGKTVRMYRPCGIVQDHPRVCGENNCSTFLEYEVSGSPPRMRGKRFRQ